METDFSIDDIDNITNPSFSKCDAYIKNTKKCIKCIAGYVLNETKDRCILFNDAYNNCV